MCWDVIRGAIKKFRNCAWIKSNNNIWFKSSCAAIQCLESSFRVSKRWWVSFSDRNRKSQGAGRADQDWWLSYCGQNVQLEHPHTISLQFRLFILSVLLQTPHNKQLNSTLTVWKIRDKFMMHNCVILEETSSMFLIRFLTDVPSPVLGVGASLQSKVECWAPDPFI